MEKKEGREKNLLCIQLFASCKKAPWNDKMIFILFLIKLTPKSTTKKLDGGSCGNCVT